MHLNNNVLYLNPKLSITLLKSSCALVVVDGQIIMLHQFMRCLAIDNEIGDSNKLKHMFYNERRSWSDIGTVPTTYVLHNLCEKVIKQLPNLASNIINILSPLPRNRQEIDYYGTKR